MLSHSQPGLNSGVGYLRPALPPGAHGAYTAAPLQSSILAAPDRAASADRPRAQFTTFFGALDGPCW